MLISKVLSLVNSQHIAADSDSFIDSLSNLDGEHISLWYNEAKEHSLFGHFQAYQVCSKRETRLIQIMKELFPAHSILLHYRHPKFMFASKFIMEFDIFIPSLSLAVEYQGEQHFTGRFRSGTLAAQQTRDKEKKEVIHDVHKPVQVCALHSITLIDVPYWWEGDKPSLAATIHQYRPELLQHASGIPIPKIIDYSSMTAVYTPHIPDNWDSDANDYAGSSAQ